jgi:cell pole-organizing protein PopZ
MSAASAKTQEPSMEEILASIRRIIAEDQDVANEPEDEGSEEQGDDESAAGEVLELPEPARASPLEPDRAPETQPEPVAEAEPQPEWLPDLDVGAPEILFGESAKEPEPLPVPEPAPVPEPVMRAPAPEPPRVSDGALTDALLSSTAGASVGQAFNLLSHTVLTQNARTLEDLVKEMLKPMLKIWLDDNLPPLVERLVRAEIERVARGRN